MYFEEESHRIHYSSFLFANFDMLEKLEVARCIECGMCTYVCPSHIKVTEGIRRAKQVLQMAPKKGGK